MRRPIVAARRARDVAFRALPARRRHGATRVAAAQNLSPRCALLHRVRVPRGSTAVPTLFRFFATLAILAGLVFAGMFALATFVTPTPREMSVTIPASKLQPGGR